MSQDENQDQDNGHNMAKVAVGAAVIGGIAAATAAVLSNKDARDNISDSVHKAEARGAEVLSGLSDQFDDLKKKIGDAVADTETSKAAGTLKESLSDLGDKLMQLRDAAGDDFNQMVEDVQTRMDNLRKDYEAMEKDAKKEMAA